MEWVAVTVGVLAFLVICVITKAWRAGRQAQEDERLRQKVAHILDERQRQRRTS
jgi:hypothetical protein